MKWGKKKCVGLIFGGNSNEHEVSISSAKTVYQEFNSEVNKELFTIKAFYINKYGDWLNSDSSEKILIGEIKKIKQKKKKFFIKKKLTSLKELNFKLLMFGFLFYMDLMEKTDQFMAYLDLQRNL